MKDKMLKAAGVKDEADFYKKYPTEEAFMKAFPQFAMGGVVRKSSASKSPHIPLFPGIAGVNTSSGTYAGGGTIHINPKNKGKFNATKARTGKTTEQLTHSSNPVTKKRAIFAQNAAKWKHGGGGVAGDEDIQFFPFDPMYNTLPLMHMAGGGYADPMAGGGNPVPIEAEGQEVMQTPGGQTQEVEGPSHEQGGVDMTVPEGTKIYSKRIKIDGKTMAERKEARDKYMMKMAKTFVKNPTDQINKDTMKRVAQVLAMEEQADMRVQEVANPMMQQQMGMGGKVRRKYLPGGMVGGAYGELDESTLGTGDLSEELGTNELEGAQESTKKLNISGIPIGQIVSGLVSMGQILAEGKPTPVENPLFEQTKAYVPYGMGGKVRRKYAYGDYVDEDGRFSPPYGTEQQEIDFSGGPSPYGEQYMPTLADNTAMRPLTIPATRQPKLKGAYNFNQWGLFDPPTEAPTDADLPMDLLPEVDDSYWGKQKAMSLDPKYGNTRYGNMEPMSDAVGRAIGMSGDERSRLATDIAARDDGAYEGEDVRSVGNTAGNIVGGLGTAIGAIGPLITTLKNRRATTPNVNAFREYGRDALETNERELAYLDQAKQAAQENLAMASNAAKARNRGNAAGVNTMRALDTITDLGYNKASNELGVNVGSQAMNVLQRRSALQNDRDLRRMTGEQTRDLADREDLDAYYSQLSQNIAGVGDKVQTYGKNLNTYQETQDMQYLMNEMSKYGIGVTRDRSGKIKVTKVKSGQ